MIRTKYMKVMEILNSEICKERVYFDNASIINAEEYKKSVENRDEKFIEINSNIMKRHLNKLDALLDLKKRIEKEIR